jgi:His-Xaa-Ser system protein HxsD
MEIKFHENELTLFIEKDIYNEDVLHKCFYWYSREFNVDISSFSNTLYSIRLQPILGSQDWQKTIERIKRDLIDFKLRDIVTKETKPIRELIVAKAFAYYGLKDDQTTPHSHPIGYVPKQGRENE